MEDLISSYASQSSWRQVGADEKTLPLAWQGKDGDTRGDVVVAAHGHPGRGHYSYVYRGLWLQFDHTRRGVPVAMKLLKDAHLFQDAVLRRRLRKEVGLWSLIRHPHILPLLGTCEDARLDDDLRLFMISPLMPGNAMVMLKQKPDIDKELLVADALAYLHAETPFKGSIAHGDVKGENVLIAEDGTAMLGDFGLSRFVDKVPSTTGTSTRMAGTLRFQAPELIFNADSVKTPKSDSFAFGMLAYQIYEGRTPFHELNDAQFLIDLHKDRRPDRPMTCDNDDIWNIATLCWAARPSNRPTMQSVYEKLCTSTADRRTLLHRQLIAACSSDESEVCFDSAGNLLAGTASGLVRYMLCSDEAVTSLLMTTHGLFTNSEHLLAEIQQWHDLRSIPTRTVQPLVNLMAVECSEFGACTTGNCSCEHDNPRRRGQYVGNKCHMTTRTYSKNQNMTAFAFLVRLADSFHPGGSPSELLRQMRSMVDKVLPNATLQTPTNIQEDDINTIFGMHRSFMRNISNLGLASPAVGAVTASEYALALRGAAWIDAFEFPDPVDLSAALFALEQPIVSAVRIADCIDAMRARETPAMRRVREVSARLRQWVQSTALLQATPEKRAAVIAYLARLAAACDRDGNVSSATTIRRALNYDLVRRLPRTLSRLRETEADLLENFWSEQRSARVTVPHIESLLERLEELHVQHIWKSLPKGGRCIVYADLMQVRQAIQDGLCAGDDEITADGSSCQFYLRSRLECILVEPMATVIAERLEKLAEQEQLANADDISELPAHFAGHSSAPGDLGSFLEHPDPSPWLDPGQLNASALAQSLKAPLSWVSRILPSPFDFFRMLWSSIAVNLPFYVPFMASDGTARD